MLQLCQKLYQREGQLIVKTRPNNIPDSSNFPDLLPHHFSFTLDSDHIIVYGNVEIFRFYSGNCGFYYNFGICLININGELAV